MAGYRSICLEIYFAVSVAMFFSDNLAEPMNFHPLKSILLIALACNSVLLYGQVTAVANLSQDFSTTHTVGYNSGASTNFREAISFTTGATATDFSSITVYGSGSGTITDFSIALYSGIAAGGPTGLVTTTNGTSSPGSLQNYVYSASSPTTLLANATYWVVAMAPTAPSGAWFAWRATASTNEDAGALSGWSIGNTRWASLNGGTSWSGLGGVMHQFSVQASAIPEPSTYAAMFGLLTLGFAAYRRRPRKSG